MKNCSESCEARKFANDLPPDDAASLIYDWQLWARDDQLPPAKANKGGPWTTWLILGGRGAGKTRAGAEWVRGLALGKPPFANTPVDRIALVGETLTEARAVMIDGPSGLLAIHPQAERPSYNASRRELTWPNGAVAQLFSADDPESLRGPQFGAAWADELAKWRYAKQTWDMLQFCLRLGENPRQVVTTTPRPIPLLKRLIADPAVAISRARTGDNAANLAPSFLTAIVGSYHGTQLGRQELDGELIEDRPDALWQRETIERARVLEAPPLEYIVVAVDPPVTSGPRSDACGIVAAGRAGDGRAYVLDDATIQGVQPLDWPKLPFTFMTACKRTASSPRLTREASWSPKCSVRLRRTYPFARCAQRVANTYAPNRLPRFTGGGLSFMRVRFPSWRIRCAISAPAASPAAPAPTGSTRWSGRSPSSC